MKRILTLGLVALGIMTQAQEKVYIGTSIDKTKYYIYPSTIRKSDYGLTVWEEWVYATPQLLKGTKKYYTTTKIQSLIECKGMKSRDIAFTHYSQNGNSVYSYSRSEYETYTKLKPQEPGSVGWAIIEATCRRYNQGY